MLLSTTTPRSIPKAALGAANVVGQPWPAGSATNVTLQAAAGILVQSDYTNPAGTFIEVGGPDVTPGNGIQLAPGDTDLINAPTATTIWTIPSANGLSLRGQVR